MTAEDFRRIALGMEGAIEQAHQGHPDFRVGGRIFATLGYPTREWGMVNLTPEQQRSQVQEYPKAFVPVKGAWGEQGCTNVRLDAIDDETLGEAMTLAWRNVLGKVKGQKSKVKGVKGKRVSSPSAARRRR